jgi:hypothetical protein
MLRLSEAECALAAAISDVCEVSHFAGWLQDTEYQVWLLLHDPLPEWGIASREELTVTLAKVRAAMDETGCWVTWPDGEDQAQAVSLGEWERRYGQWQTTLQ